MKSRYTLAVVAIVIASVVVPGAAIASTVADSQAQTAQPDEVPEEAEVQNVTVTGLTTSFTMEEMNLTSSSTNVTLQDAEVMIENASMSLESATFENGTMGENDSLMVEGGELSVENATVTAAMAEVETDGLTVTLTNQTFTVENRTLTLENRTLEGTPGVPDNVSQDEITLGPVTIDRDTARNALQNGTIDSMTVTGVSGDMALDQASVEDASWDDRSASGHVMEAEALVRNGSVTLENVSVENGALVIESGSVHVQDGDAFITEAVLESDGDRVTFMNKVLGIEDRTFEFSDVELTPQDVMEMVFGDSAQ